MKYGKGSHIPLQYLCRVLLSNLQLSPERSVRNILSPNTSSADTTLLTLLTASTSELFFIPVTAKSVLKTTNHSKTPSPLLRSFNSTSSGHLSPYNSLVSTSYSRKLGNEGNPHFVRCNDLSHVME